MSHPPYPRLAWEPVQARLDAVARSFAVTQHTELTPWAPYSRSSLAERVGLTRRSVYRYVHDGVPLAVADDVAFAVGLHPNELWGAATLAEFVLPERTCEQRAAAERERKRRDRAARRAQAEVHSR